MSESCPGEKYKSGLLPLSAGETIKEEVIRDRILRLLLSEKGYQEEDLELDMPFSLVIGPDTFSLKASILIQLGGKKVMLIKCGAGSILARERATLALARIFTDYQIPLSVVTNSEDATLLNTLNGETLECGLAAIPGRGQLLDRLEGLSFVPLPDKRLKMEKQILSAFEALGLHGECR